MAASIDTITNEGGQRWRFEISGTQPFRWYLDGARIAFNDDDEDGASPTTDRIIEGGDLEEPPPVEVLDSTETQTPDNLLYAPRVRLQWRGIPGMQDYTISLQDSTTNAFNRIATVRHNPDQGYQHYETKLFDGGDETLRIVANDGRGNSSTNLDYTVLVVRNFAPPVISASYDPATGDLTISTRE